MEKSDVKENNKLIGFEELLRSFIVMNRRAVIILYLAIPLTLALRFIGVNITNGFLTVMFVFAVTISLYYYLLTNKVKTSADMENASMFYFITNILLYTAIIHYNGGIEGMLVLIYAFVIVEANIVLPRKKSIFIVLLTVLSYSVMALLEFFGIISHNEFSIVGEPSYQNPQFVLFSIIAIGLLGFNYIGLVASTFSNIYRRISNHLIKERTELVKTQSELQEAKDTLEVRVGARTKELEEFTAHLEDQVKNRTKELREKVAELEKFQKVTVGREMKMMELKEKITELEKTSKKGKKEKG
jgi:hypothetical protein